MRTMLIAVTGMSPQVITETLYALDQRGLAWPEGICLMTTAVGADRARNGLLARGHLAALCQRLERPVFTEADIDIRTIPDAEGHSIDDVRTLADQEALGNFIMQSVRDFTEDDDTQIHASIAGGRKSMTFYLGYAMSLFGRPRDRLSHVLISDGYEQHPDFYFPTREPGYIETRTGQRLDTRDARVELADIPFIRQRDELPNFLKSAGTNLDLRCVIDQINLAHQPDAIRLAFDDHRRRLDIGNPERWLTHVVFDNPQHWAWLKLVAIATRDQDPSLRLAPGSKHKTGSQALGAYMADRMIAVIGELTGISGPNPPADRRAIQQWIDDHENDLEHAGFRLKDLRSSLAGAGGFNPSNFNNRIKARLADALPRTLAERLAAKQYFQEDGTRRTEPMHLGGYALNVPSESIRFGDAS